MLTPLRQSRKRDRLVSPLCSALAAQAIVLASVAQGQAPVPEPMKVRVDASYAQPLPFERGAAGLAESLRKLRTRASLIRSTRTRTMKMAARSLTEAAPWVRTFRCWR